MPEGRDHHVLDGAGLAVGEFYLRFLLAFAWRLAALRTRRFFALTRAHAASVTGVWRFLRTYAWHSAAFLADLGLNRLAIPFRIVEVVVGTNKDVDREVIRSEEHTAALQ